MTAEEMIEGQIYFVKTAYNWIIRFKKITRLNILGYGCMCNGAYGEEYINTINSHIEIRPATPEEIQLYESEEIKKLNIKPKILIFN